MVAARSAALWKRSLGSLASMRSRSGWCTASDSGRRGTGAITCMRMRSAGPLLAGEHRVDGEILGEAEVDDHGAAVGTEEDVVGLEVAVDDAARMDRIER